jgi:hypothetical protein
MKTLHDIKTWLCEYRFLPEKMKIEKGGRDHVIVRDIQNRGHQC